MTVYGRTRRRSAARSGLTLLGVAVLLAGLVAAGLVAANQWFGTPIIQQCEARAGGYTATVGLQEARNAALIAAVSVRRGMPPRAATIALATAMQESGLRNLRYGHLDSLGLFQQRPSQGWGTAAQIGDPYYAADRFYTALDRVDGYAGMDIAAAAQRVQRSADGTAYAQHEGAARALASTLTGQTAAGFACTVREGAVHRTPAATLRAELARAFGPLPVRATGSGLAVEVADPDLGWAVAQWAVANAADLGLARAGYDGRVWRLDRSGDGWRRSADDAGTATVRLTRFTD